MKLLELFADDGADLAILIEEFVEAVIQGRLGLGQGVFEVGIE